MVGNQELFLTVVDSKERNLIMVRNRNWVSGKLGKRSAKCGSWEFNLIIVRIRNYMIPIQVGNSIS